MNSKVFRINPTVFLERIGIDNFRIVYEDLAVYLPGLEFKRLARQAGINISDVTTMFYAFGWKWEKDQE